MRHSIERSCSVQVSCITDGEVKAVGDSWLSDDLCTTYSCVKNSNVSTITTNDMNNNNNTTTIIVATITTI